MDLSGTELVLILTTAGTSIRWWIDRRDARSALATDKTEADKTVATLTATVTAKNEELERKDELIERQDQRIAHLESLVYARGQS